MSRQSRATFTRLRRSGYVLAMLLLLAAPFAHAKKLYKFQDESGRWHFSDKPPVTDQKVEVEQLRVETKQRVRLQERGGGPRREYYMVNDYQGAIEAEVAFDEAENAYSDPPLPRRFVIPGAQTGFLLHLGPVDPGRPWRAGLRYRVVPGDPAATHTPEEPYLPPIAPGERFQISQAFNGKYTHQDPQNRFAVDIVMPVGTAVHAARGGTVMSVDNDFFGNGVGSPAYQDRANSIRIVHADGTMGVYAHLELERAQVYPGLEVERGQLIGYSGNTGYTTGPHLHFVVQRNAGMKLESVPFVFTGRGDKVLEPTEGMWLRGLGTPGD